MGRFLVVSLIRPTITSILGIWGFLERASAPGDIPCSLATQANKNSTHSIGGFRENDVAEQMLHRTGQMVV